MLRIAKYLVMHKKPQKAAHFSHYKYTHTVIMLFLSNFLLFAINYY